MSYGSYEYFVMRDRPSHWWRLGPANTSPGVMSIGQPGQGAAATSGSTAPVAGPGLPGAASRISTFTTGTSASAGVQGWTAVHTMPGSSAVGFTMEIWFKYPENYTVTATQSMIFIRNNCGFWLDGENKLEFAVTGLANSFEVTTPKDPMATWNHCVGVFKPTATEFYIQGQRYRTLRSGGNPESFTVDLTASATTYIGASGAFGRTSFAGFLAEPALYPYPLSPSQILDHYQAGIRARRSEMLSASSLYPFTAPVTPTPGGLTPITEGLPNKRVLMVSDRPR